MRQSSWQRFRKLEQGLKKNLRISGEIEDLCVCPENRFKQIVCNNLNLSSGHYYEYLFSCILFTVLGEQFQKADIRSDITEHFDAKICGIICDFTMRSSQKRKQAREGITLIRFPHKNYHKGMRVKRDIVEIVLEAVRGNGIPIIPDDNLSSKLIGRVAKYAY